MAINSINAPLIDPTIRENGYLFDRLEISKGDLPKGVDLSGCIAITRDRNHTGWLHILMWIGQLINAILFKRKTEYSTMAHGLIIVKHDDNKPNNLIVAHSVYSGIRTSRRNYLAENEVTEMVVYIPKDRTLRDSLINYANQTAFNPKDKEGVKKAAEFSTCDMLGSILHNRKYTKGATRSETVMRRVSEVVTDLLLGTQLLNKKNQVRSYFCTPYATSILQGSILINSMKPEEIEDLKKLTDRQKIADAIFNRIKEKNSDDALSKTYWEHRVCRWNTRFIMSSVAAASLDRMSEPYKATP